MRILITGYSAAACGSTRIRNYRYSPIESLTRGLQIAGHTVEQREIKAGEPLNYDAAFVQLLSPMSMMALSPRKFGAMWAMHELPHCVVFDDGMIRQAYIGHDNPNSFWRMLDHDADADIAALMPHRKAIDGLTQRWKTKLPLAMFFAWPWGDRRAIHSEWPGEWHDIDPSWHYRPTTPTAAARQRRWIYAALARSMERVLDKLTPSWEVRRFGQGLHANFVAEHVLVQECADARGLVCQPYSFNGSGWWRPRFKIAQVARAVAYTWPSDMPADYPRAPMNVIEAMSDEELDLLVHRQSEWLDAHSADEAAFQTKLETILCRVKSMSPGRLLGLGL